MSCSGDITKRFLAVLKALTVEPLMFMYLIAWVLQTALTTSLVYDKVCEQTNPGGDCRNKSKIKEEKEDEIQVTVSQYNMYLNIIEMLPSIIFILFLGSWSDVNGRKIPLVLPLIGSVVGVLICLINAYVWWLHPAHILLTIVPRALTGGSKSFFMAVYAYITDISSEEHRTTRIAYVDVMLIVAPPISYGLSGVLFGTIGYIGVYAVSAAMLFLCVLYVLLYLKETRGPFAHEDYINGRIEGSKKYSNFFNAEHVKETLSVCIKRRKNRSTIIVLMILICIMGFRKAIVGIDYLYTIKKFGWNYFQFVYWSIAYYLSMAVGESIVLPILSSCFHVEEYILGVIGAISRIAGSALQAFSNVSSEFYTAAFVGFLSEIPISVARSKISKLIDHEDIGKVYSMLASWEAIVPLVSNPVYTFTYNASIKQFPGAVFIVTLGLFVIVGVTLLVMYIRKLLHCEKDETTEEGTSPYKFLLTKDEQKMTSNAISAE